MKSFALRNHRLASCVLFLWGYCLLQPGVMWAGERSDSHIQSLRERLTAPSCGSRGVETAIRNAVHPLDLSGRAEVRAFAVHEALVSTNTEMRLALFDTAVDATLWTNSGERLVSDDLLLGLLKEAYQDGRHMDIRDRAIVPLLRRQTVSSEDREWVGALVRSGRWDALPLAIRWGNRSLEAVVRAAITSSNAVPCSARDCATIYPQFYVEGQIDAISANRNEWLKLRNRLGRERVCLEDLMMAYLAWAGDGLSRQHLLSHFQNAASPAEFRRPQDRDKLYWYGLISLTGELPGPLPIP